MAPPYRLNPRYTAEFMASLRHRYEETNQSMRSIADDFGIGERTLHRIVDREEWKKRGERPPRELPMPIRLLDEANAMLAQSRHDAKMRVPGAGQHEATAECCAADPEPSAAVDGPRLCAAARPGHADHPQQPGHDDAPPAPALSAADRLERLLLGEIAVEEARREKLALLRPTAEATRTARTLSILTQALQAVQRLRLAEEHLRSDKSDSQDDHDDDLPRDIDEFRRDLARRIDAFVASRTDGRHAAGDPGPQAVDEAR